MKSALRDDEVPGNSPATIVPIDHQPSPGRRLYRVWVKSRPGQTAYAEAVNRKQAIAAARREWPNAKGIRAELCCPSLDGQPPVPCPLDACPGACRRCASPAQPTEARGTGYVPDFAYT